jgi:hypothetical protein
MATFEKANIGEKVFCYEAQHIQLILKLQGDKFKRNLVYVFTFGLI